MKQMFVVPDELISWDDLEEFAGSEEEFLAIEKFHLKAWKLNREFHREDGPAVIYSNGSEYWLRNGKYHRENGPAIINSNGYQAWYKNGCLHRIGGPAVRFKNADEEWYENGLLHREDGYAVIWRDKYNGRKEFWIKGERLHSEDDFNKARAAFSLENENPIIKFLKDNFDITLSDEGFEKLQEIKKSMNEFEKIKRLFQN